MLDRWAMAGWVGVDLFFVLSGFLVSGLLFQEYRATRGVRVGRFLLRRGFKIYPAFYTLIAVTVVADLLLARPVPPSHLLGEVFFVQNYVGGLWTHTWSLAVEEHFYLLLAVLVAGLVSRRSPSRDRGDPFAVILPLFAVVAVLALGARFVTAAIASPELALHLAPTHLRIDSLLSGVVLSYLFHFRREWLAARVQSHHQMIALVSVLAVAPCLFLPVTSRVMQTIGFTSLYIGFGGLLLLALHRAPAPASSGRPHPAMAAFGLFASALAWLGTYSYSIYLWHMPVQAWSTIVLARTTGWLPPATLAWCLYFVEAIGAGVLMSLLIERPGLALRERLAVTAGRSPLRAGGPELTQREERAA
jgi:peptidoglycan/LPS O-acetylase OafA/YrhL